MVNQVRTFECFASSPFSAVNPPPPSPEASEFFAPYRPVPAAPFLPPVSEIYILPSLFYSPLAFSQTPPTAFNLLFASTPNPQLQDQPCRPANRVPPPHIACSVRRRCTLRRSPPSKSSLPSPQALIREHHSIIKFSDTCPSRAINPRTPACSHHLLRSPPFPTAV